MISNRTPEPIWGKGIQSNRWLAGTSGDYLFKRCNITPASLERSLGGAVDAAALRRALSVVGLQDTASGVLYQIKRERAFLVLFHRGHFSSAFVDRRLAIYEYSRDELLASWQLIEAIEKARVSNDLLPSWFVMRLLFCAAWSFLFDDLYCSQLQALTEQLEADPDLGQDPTVWFVLPPALAGVGQVERAKEIALRLIDSFGNQWMSDLDASTSDSFHGELQRETLYRHTLAQICLAMLEGNKKKAQVRELISICDDLDLLMQILTCYARQQAGEELIGLVADAICRLVSRVPLEDRFDISPSNFLGLCVELLLADRSDVVQCILAAFCQPWDVVQVVEEIVRLSPWSLEGMLLACDELGHRKVSLRLDRWPGSVLLQEAEKVTSLEDFTRIIEAIHKIFDNVDILKYYRAVVSHLQPPALQTMLEAVLSEDSEKLHDLDKAILLSSVVSLPTERDKLSQVPLNRARIAMHADHLLESYKSHIERHYRVFPWRYNQYFWGYWGLKVSPPSTYSLGMSALFNDCTIAGLLEEAQMAKAKAMTTLYGELRKVERWSDGIDFKHVLYMILDELGGKDLVKRVVQIFEIWNWQ